MGQLTVTEIEHLSQKREELALMVSERLLNRLPGISGRKESLSRERCYKDILFHFDNLIAAMHVDSTDLFDKYLEWSAAMLKERDVQWKDLPASLVYMKTAVQSLPGINESGKTCKYLESGMDHLKSEWQLTESFIKPDNVLRNEASTYLKYLLNGDRVKASRVIDELLAGGESVKNIYEYVFEATQYEIGLLWQNNKITVAHEHYCTAATQMIMSHLYPKIFSEEKTGRRLVACSVSSELHEMGIRMVSDFFEMDGWDTYYIGANVPAVDVTNVLKEFKADILAISVTLPIHLIAAEEIIKEVRNHHELTSVRILTGGYPFNIVPDLWQQIGADGTAKTAKTALQKAAEWF